MPAQSIAPTRLVLRPERGIANLGRGLAAILAASQSQPQAALRFLHVSARRSNLPAPRKLAAGQVRECGPRSGLSFRLSPWWRVKHTEGEFTPATTAQLLMRVANHQPAASAAA